ncbi:MAG TPA: lipoprotein [Burkholderiaceae bacterium]
MKRAVAGTAILAVLTALAACGQRGPLYLPDQPRYDPPAPKRAPASTTAQPPAR